MAFCIRSGFSSQIAVSSASGCSWTRRNQSPMCIWSKLIPAIFHLRLIAPDDGKRLGDLPGSAIFAGQPFGVAGATGEIVLRRVPLHGLPVIVGKIDQMTGGDAPGADFDVGDGTFAALDRVEEVLFVIGAGVKFDLWIGEELLFHGIQLG